MTIHKSIVYVAGPYRAATWEGREANIQRALAVALECWKRGYPTICPHMNTAHFDGEAPDELWLAGDLVLLEACKYMVLVPGWEDSRGTLAEIDHAEMKGIKVLLSPDELP